MAYQFRRGLIPSLVAALVIGFTGSPPGAARAAGEYLTLSSFSGHAGVTVQVSGGNFAPGTPLEIFAGPDSTPDASATTDASGMFSAPLLIPPVGAGPLTISALGGGASAANSYYVQPYFPTLQVSPGSAAPYSTVAVDGHGYAPDETVTLTLAGATGTATTDADGAFTGAALTVPALSPGTRTVEGVGSLSGASGVGYLYVSGFYPSVTPSSYYLLPGQHLTFSGGGFANGETVDVSVVLGTTSQTLASFSVGTDGSYTDAGSVSIPFSAAGMPATYVLKGRVSGASTSVGITIGQFYANVSPSEYYVMPGATLYFSGTGFAGNETVAVMDKTGSTTLATVTTDEYGQFYYGGAVTVPVTAGGTTATWMLKGELSGAVSQAQVTVGNLNALLSPSSYYLLPGSWYYAEAHGFLPGEDVKLTVAGADVATVTSNDGGYAMFDGLTFPVSAFETVKMTATGLTTGATASATVAVGKYYPYAVSSSYYVRPGDTVTVSGASFAPWEKVTATIGSQTVTGSADGDGAIDGLHLTVPFGIAPKDAVITVTGAISANPSMVSLVIAPFSASLTPSTYYGSAGSTITFTASGFAAGETVTLRQGTTTVGTATVASGGTAEGLSDTLPFGVTSVGYSLKGSMSGATAEVTIGIASFYAGVQLQTYYAVGGTPNVVSGGGFAANETVNITWGGAGVGSAVTDGDGAFSLALDVPYSTAGTKAVVATGAKSGASATTSFTQAQVYVSLQLGAYAGAPGEAVTFIGTGYLPSEPLQVTTDRTSGVVHTFSADASGNFTDSGFVIPTDMLPGEVKLTVTGTHSLTPMTITYYVTGG